MKKPNILFLMTDQMQGMVLDSESKCQTPNLDRLMERGTWFRRAYTPNAVCSPARASLMTGQLPHNHGVEQVTHVVPPEQCRIRHSERHWAELLSEAGYKTGYFGKWHVDREEEPKDFGWQVDASDEIANRLKANKEEWGEESFSLEYMLSNPGYNTMRFYGVTDMPPEKRRVGVNAGTAAEFLDEVLEQDEQPWCCFVSTQEPHDPYICGQEAFDKYDVDSLPLSPSLHDELAGRPNIYKKAAWVWKDMGERQHREAMACYYATITEIDQIYGGLIDKVEAAGQLDNTIVVFSADHGDHMGAHGLYCKNFGAGEEVYNIPLIMSGPGIAQGCVTDARVGLQDLCPTITELAGLVASDIDDSRSFAPFVGDPKAAEKDWQSGYAEYFGGRMLVTQRVVWDGPWKLVFNGFDFDELYNLEEDPYEMRNLAEDSEYAEVLERMFAIMWERVKTTNDMPLWHSQYPILRVASYGPNIIKE